MSEMLRIISEMRCEACYVGNHSCRTSALGNIHCLCCDDMVNDPVRYARTEAKVEPRFPLGSPSRAPEPEYKDVSKGFTFTNLSPEGEEIARREAENYRKKMQAAGASRIGYSLAGLVDDKLCTLNDELTRKPRLSRKELKRQLREVLEERNNLKDRVGELKQELETTLAERTEARKVARSLRDSLDYWQTPLPADGIFASPIRTKLPWEQPNG